MSLSRYTPPAQTPNLLVLYDDSVSMQDSITTDAHWTAETYLSNTFSERVTNGSWMAYGTSDTGSCPTTTKEKYTNVLGLLGTPPQPQPSVTFNLRKWVDAKVQEINDAGRWKRRKLKRQHAERLNAYLASVGPEDEKVDLHCYDWDLCVIKAMALDQNVSITVNSGPQIAKKYWFPSCTNSLYSHMIQFNPSVLGYDWRVLSSDFNRSYYDPEINYKPWAGFEDADFFNAKLDARLVDSINLSSVFKDGFVYYQAIDDKGYSSGIPAPSGVTNGPNGEVDLWDSHERYTVLANGTIRKQTIRYSGIKECSVPALWNDIPYQGCWGASVTPATFGSGSIVHNFVTRDGRIRRTVEQEQTNIANWFTYHRTRMQMAAGVLTR
jgi:hypothetical protein